MTISSTQTVFAYNSDGTSTTFGYSSIFFSPGDLLVQLFSTSTGAAFMPAPVLNGSQPYDYQVEGTQDPASGEYLSGASVVFNIAPAAGYIVVIALNMKPIQNRSFNNNSLFPAKTLEGALDYLTLLQQQAPAAGVNAIKFPSSDPIGLNQTLPAVANRAGQVVCFDLEGNVTTCPLQGSNGANVWSITGANYVIAEFDIDYTFTPPLIRQSGNAFGTIASNGNVNLKLFLPTMFPNFAVTIVAAASWIANAGWQTFAGQVTGGDGKTFFNFSIYGAVPGSAYEVNYYAVGF